MFLDASNLSTPSYSSHPNSTFSPGANAHTAICLCAYVHRNIKSTAKSFMVFERRRESPSLMSAVLEFQSIFAARFRAATFGIYSEWSAFRCRDDVADLVKFDHRSCPRWPTISSLTGLHGFRIPTEASRENHRWYVTCLDLSYTRNKQYKIVLSRYCFFWVGDEYFMLV